MLQVDAIVNSTNESMNDGNPVSNRIFQKAGSELKEEINLDIRGRVHIIYIVKVVYHLYLIYLNTYFDFRM